MSKANCTYKFHTAAGPVTIQGMSNMKAWLAVNGVEAITRPTAEDQTQTEAFRRWFSPSPRDVVAGLPESVINGLETHAKAIADFLESEAVTSHRGGLFKIPRPVLLHMVEMVSNDKILDAIVGAIPVDVVNFLGRKKLPAKDVLHDVTVLENVLSVDPESDVALGVDPSSLPLLTVRVIANAAAKITGLTGGPFKRNAAILADANDPVLGAHVRNSANKDLSILRGFGDSKVVDAEGKPLVVYHGTRNDFSVFDPESHFGTLAQAQKVLGYRARMETGAPSVMPVYLAINNPKRVDDVWDWPAEVEKAKAEGYDGLVYQNWGEFDPDVSGNPRDSWVAFEPTQIKSATGNRGTFDPTSPDIRFRTVREAVSGTVNDFRDVALPAGYRVNDLMGAPNKLDWWHKTVGTQFDLAQRSPLFKRVFDGAQEFLSDVSFYANEAANLAPTILPKLETLRDITKKPISAEDSQAIARPIFEGTLTWGRDPNTGKAVKMEVLEARAAQLDAEAKGQELIRRGLLDPKVLRMWQGMELDRYTTLVENKYAAEVLKPGTVFTDKELKDLFGLNDRQAKLYREFRKATNKSLGDLAVTDMVRFGGKDVEAVRARALGAPNPRSAANVLRSHLLDVAEADPARREVLVSTANAMLDKAEKAVELMDQGYAPLMRFGQYTVDVLDEAGERAYFGMFETQREANKMARQMRANYPGGTVVQGTLSQEEYKLFSGVSPETVELFGNMLGLESGGDGAGDTAFQEFLKKVKANRSAMKRLIHRKGIAGFNEEPGRVLAGFLYSNARQASSNVHMGELTQAVSDIPKTQGELKDHAVKLRDYVMNPQEEAQALRSVLFAQYLGGSVASALLNAMQPVQVTFPWLSQFGGAAKAAKQMTAAIADVLGKKKLDDRLAKALQRAEEEGIVSPQEIHQLQAQAAGRAALVGGDGTRAGDLLAAGNNALSRVSLAWGKLFGVAEQFNRRTTFIAAYRTAVEQGMSDPAEFAKRAVQETQFVYNKGNKPKWARGAIGATLFTFKQYSVSYVELMHRMYTQGGKDGKKAALLGLAVLFLMSGADGLPFAEDIQDLIDGVLQRMGYNVSTRKAKEQFFRDLMGEGGAQFMERGLSGLPGAPVDVSGRMGLGNLIPGTGAFYRKDNYGRDMLEVLGPAADLVGRVTQAGEKAVKGELLGARGALMTVSPLAAQNLGKAWEMYTTGMYLDRGGKKVVDADGFDAFWKAMGLQPNAVSRIQQGSFEVQKGVAFNRLSESEIADKWARGVFLGDSELVAQAKADLASWNQRNPDMPIRIKPNQIAARVKKMRESKEERIAKSAPSEIRARVREELAGL